MGVEFAIERKVCAHAKKLGWIVRKVQFIGRRGAPDRMFLREGEIAFIEFKAPDDGVLSEHQKREIKLLRDLGFTVEIIDNEEEGYAFFDARA